MWYYKYLNTSFILILQDFHYEKTQVYLNQTVSLSATEMFFFPLFFVWQSQRVLLSNYSITNRHFSWSRCQCFDAYQRNIQWCAPWKQLHCGLHTLGLCLRLANHSSVSHNRTQPFLLTWKWALMIQSATMCVKSGLMNYYSHSSSNTFQKSWPLNANEGACC